MGPGWVILSLLLAAAPAPAETGGSGAAAEQAFEAALARQREAERAASAAHARRGLEEAVGLWADAARLRPEHYRTQALWGTALAQLCYLADGPAERDRLADAARQRFARAAACPDAEPGVYQQHLRLLRNILLPRATDPDQRRLILEEIVALLERALAAVGPAAPLHSVIASELGSALTEMTDPASTAPETVTRLQRAVNLLQTAARTPGVQRLIDRRGSLGLALFCLGRISGDPTMLRRAAAAYEQSLRWFPFSLTARYNLACIYSRLGQPDEAIPHLARVLDHDSTGNYTREAERDPDLAAVRGNPGYAEAVDRRRQRLAAVEADKLFRQAWRAQQIAEHTNDTATALFLLRQAVATYDRAIALRPEHHDSQVLCGIAHVDLTHLLANEADQQRRHADAAREHLALAAQCGTPRSTFFDTWASFLLSVYYPMMRTTAEKQAALSEAREAIEQGIEQVGYTGPRRRLQALQGQCLVLMAEAEPPGPGAVALYDEAIPYFTAASDSSGTPFSAEYHVCWGVALLRVGAARQDAALVRAARQQLQTALEKKPGHRAAHYNLACAYAVLQQPDRALHHLQASVDGDSSGLYYGQCLRDPDLEPLRRSQAFRRVFGKGPPLSAVAPPRVTGQ